MNELTHKVEITITGNYPHGGNQHASISISGDGGLSHMFEAFKAALVAAGFAMDTAKKLDEIDSPSPPEPDRRELLARCAKGLREMLPIFDILAEDPSAARYLAEKGIRSGDFEAFVAEVEEASN